MTFLELLLPIILGTFIPIIIGEMLLFRIAIFGALERWPLAWGLGTGFLTYGMFLGSMLGINFLITFLYELGILLILFVFFIRHRKTVQLDINSLKIDWLTGVLLLISSIILALITIRSWSGMHTIWDHWAVWAFKAKIYFLEQRIPFERFFYDFPAVWGNWDYPHHVPLLDAWYSTCAGSWNELFVRMVPVIFLVMFCFFLFGTLSRCTTPLAGATVILLLTSMKSLKKFTEGAILEPVVLFYYISAFILILRSQKKTSPVLVLLAGVMAGMGAWTKNEGVAYALMNAVCLLAIYSNKDRWKALLIYMAGMIPVILPWWILKNWMGLKNVLINHEVILTAVQNWYQYDLGRVWEALVVFFLIDKTLLGIWGLFLISLCFFPFKSLLREQRVILFSIAMHLCMILLFSFIDRTSLFLDDAFQRLFLAPSILTMLYLASFFKKEEGPCS